LGNTGRALATIALISMFLPWVTIGIYLGPFSEDHGGYSLYQILNSVVQHHERVKNFFEILNGIANRWDFAEKVETNLTLLLVGTFLIPIGILIALISGGRAGHVLGLFGMILFTLGIHPFVNNDIMEHVIKLDIGYYLAWIGFGLGVLFAGGSKGEAKTSKKSTPESKKEEPTN